MVSDLHKRMNDRKAKLIVKQDGNVAMHLHESERVVMGGPQ